MRTLLTIALSGLIAATPAVAQPIDENYSVEIAYGDINLSNPAGLAKLAGRVKNSADSICFGAGDSPLQQSLQAQSCRADFIKTAEQKLQAVVAPARGRVVVGR